MSKTVALLMADVTKSSWWARHLKNSEYLDYIIRPFNKAVMKVLEEFKINPKYTNDTFELIDSIGDEYFLCFSNASTAVHFALRLHQEVDIFPTVPDNILKEVNDKIVRSFHIGISQGELETIDNGGSRKYAGMEILKTKRVTSIAQGAQTLTTKQVHDNVVKNLEIEYVPYDHGAYQLDGFNLKEQIYEFCIKGTPRRTPRSSVTRLRTLALLGVLLLAAICTMGIAIVRYSETNLQLRAESLALSESSLAITIKMESHSAAGKAKSIELIKMIDEYLVSTLFSRTEYVSQDGKRPARAICDYFKNIPLDVYRSPSDRRAYLSSRVACGRLEMTLENYSQSQSFLDEAVNGYLELDRQHPEEIENILPLAKAYLFRAYLHQGMKNEVGYKLDHSRATHTIQNLDLNGVKDFSVQDLYARCLNESVLPTLLSPAITEEQLTDCEAKIKMAFNIRIKQADDPFNHYAAKFGLVESYISMATLHMKKEQYAIAASEIESARTIGLSALSRDPKNPALRRNFYMAHAVKEQIAIMDGKYNELSADILQAMECNTDLRQFYSSLLAMTENEIRTTLTVQMPNDQKSKSISQLAKIYRVQLRNASRVEMSMIRRGILFVLDLFATK